MAVSLIAVVVQVNTVVPLLLVMPAVGAVIFWVITICAGLVQPLALLVTITV